MRLALIMSVLLIGSACSAAAGGDENLARENAAGPEGEPAPIGNDRSAAGSYRLAGQREMASALLLQPDGRFRYFLSYGSLDQHAEGRWSSDGRRVALNTDPRPRPPEFSMRPASRSTAAPLVVMVTAPNGAGLGAVDLRIGLADGRVLEGYTQDYGWRLPAGERADAVQWIELSLEPYGVPARRFAVGGSSGNQFNFTFTPNDFGVVDFRDRIFEIAGRDLVLREQGETITYARGD